MGKARISDPLVRDREVMMALGDAVTRAVYKAPESLLRQFTGDRLKHACHALAMHTKRELHGDGWVERRSRMGHEDLVNAMAEGFEKAGEAILRAIPHAHVCDNLCQHHCDKALLNGIGSHLGAKALAAMKRREIAIQRRPMGPAR